MMNVTVAWLDKPTEVIRLSGDYSYRKLVEELKNKHRFSGGQLDVWVNPGGYDVSMLIEDLDVAVSGNEVITVMKGGERDAEATTDILSSSTASDSLSSPTNRIDPFLMAVGIVVLIILVLTLCGWGVGALVEAVKLGR